MAEIAPLDWVPVLTSPTTPVSELPPRRAHAARDALRHAGPGRRSRRPWHRFYYDDLYGYVRDQIPPGARVLDLGCGDGELLASLRPSFGVGVELSEPLIAEARRRHPELQFVCADIEGLPLAGTFDYVVLSNVVGYLDDVWTFFRDLSRVVTPETRLVMTYYNFAWEPVLNMAERAGLKAREPLQNWLSRADLVELLDLADFEAVSSGYRTPLPVGPRVVAAPLNRILSLLPVVRRLGITAYVTARPMWREVRHRVGAPSCSVVIPARNERGNVRAALGRLPALGRSTEVVFVEGGSRDGTFEEIEAAIADHPELDVKLIAQGDGVGKGDAVRKGFAASTGDVLMILDADLTVPPEDLPKFLHAIVQEKGEFINGTRMVYPMEDQAMRLANIAGNKFFSIVFSRILQQRITDTLCGTKVLWRRDYERIAANRHVFGDFDPFGDYDLLFGAANLGLKIREVPVRYRERAYGSTNIDRWRHGVLLLRMAVIGARRLRLR